MNALFDAIQNRPENSIFSIVFFPDRIYHAQYLNAARSPRYRYYVHEVRHIVDMTVMKGLVFLDGGLLARFIRIEYRASRLVEQARERGRLLRGLLLAHVKLLHQDPSKNADATVHMHYDNWINAYQVEIWDSLEPPPTKHHDAKVTHMMGHDGSITRVRRFAPALADLDNLRQVELAFRENDVDFPFGDRIGNPQWDNNYGRTYQVPNTQEPSSPQNTAHVNNYRVDFQRGWFFKNVGDIAPVRYKNARMDPTCRDFNYPGPNDNTIEMRWVLQREFGSSIIYFMEVTVPPGTVDGTHQHIGTEELYYICEGEGVAYLGDGNDPSLSDDTQYPLRNVEIFGLPNQNIRELKVQPGSVIFTKSGGIHGIRNLNSDQPLRFVAFGYHSA